MRMSDIVGYLDLSVYPQVALVLFLGVFAGGGVAHDRAVAQGGVRGDGPDPAG